MAHHNTEKQKPMDEKGKAQHPQQQPGQGEQQMPGQQPGQREKQTPGQQNPGQREEQIPKAPEPGRSERSDRESIGQPVQLDRERP